MTEAHGIPETGPGKGDLTRRSPGRRLPSGKRPGRLLVATMLAAALLPGTVRAGGERSWTLQLEPILMEVYGHDPHVLTIHRFDAAEALVEKTGVNLETSSDLAWRGEFQRMTGQWGWGVDVFWFITSQDTADRSEAPGGGVEAVAFQIADRFFTSGDPSQSLIYHVLEDTDLAAWTLDLYAIRILAEKPQSDIRLQFGLRSGDFDNDYRAVAGLQDVVGTRVDASSNYDRMYGPLLGLAARARFGKNRINAYLGQSVLVGSVELTHRSRDFAGSSDAAFPVEVELDALFGERFHKVQDVAIPITEIRFKWTRRLTDRLALGVGAHAAAWWDVPAPPGVLPITGGSQLLSENTIVFSGLLAALEMSF